MSTTRPSHWDWMRTNGKYPESLPVVPVQVEFDTYRGSIKPTVPLELSLEAYKEYAEQYGTSQSHDRMIERGGFGILEIAVLLFERIKRLEGQ